MRLNPDPARSPEVDGVLSELFALRRFEGQASEFWPSLIAKLARLVGASRGILILRSRKEPEVLRKLSEWTSGEHATPNTALFLKEVPGLVASCGREEWGQVLFEKGTGRSASPGAAIAARLILQASEEECFAAFLLEGFGSPECQEAAVRLRLAADIPMAYQTHLATLQATRSAEQVAGVMDLMVAVNAETRFLAASLALCNAVASRFGCERTSLGWLENERIRLKSISRTAKFDKNMLAVKAIETVMEESIDQDEEVMFPPAEGTNPIFRDHADFAAREKVSNLVSLPIRLADKPIGVLLCERQSNPFSNNDIRQLRLTCDQSARRLSDLFRTDRWFGSRWKLQVREKCGKWLGPEHTWAKVLGLLGAVAVVALILPIYPYRVEGNFILRSDEVSFLTAPFDGYIKSAEVRPGDALPAGGVLLSLNTEQLELEEAAAIADQTRYLREAEKSRAARALAEMRISQALGDQAKSKLDLVRYRLAQSTLRSPWASVVVEGDLRQRIGAPVKQGDAMFKVARLDRLYVEAEINERDVHHILDKTVGEIAFVAQPKLKFLVKVARIEPAAVPKQRENVFVARAELATKAEVWWRPGMSGICKIEVGKRTLLWIISHRTLDYLRMWLWW
jgi:hypothetical protein